MVFYLIFKLAVMVGFDYMMTLTVLEVTRSKVKVTVTFSCIRVKCNGFLYASTTGIVFS